MALIKCPECGEEISDTSKRCIHCGYKLKHLRKKKVLSKKKIILIGVMVFTMLTIFIGGSFTIYHNYMIPVKKYEKANNLLKDGKYDQAIKIYKKLDGYKKSKVKIKEAYYKQALELCKNEKYSDAIMAFDNAGNYKDSKNQGNTLKTKEKMQKAYDSCNSYDTIMEVDKSCITVDSKDKYDLEGIGDIKTIIKNLDLPDSLLQEMLSTNALMGRQTETYDNYKVSWSYHPDNGLDAIFKIKE